MKYKYRVVREEVAPDLYTYYPEFYNFLWWERFEEGPYGSVTISFSSVDDARAYIDKARKGGGFKPEKKVVWEG